MCHSTGSIGDTLIGPFLRSEIQEKMHELKTVALWLCAFTVLMVFTVIFYTLIQHQQTSEQEYACARYVSKREILWAFVTFVMFILLFLPAFQSAFH